MTKTRKLKAAVALGSLTATVALLTGLSGASAQTAPGGGSFPGSFLVPGTNTSIGFHGFIQMDATYDMSGGGRYTNVGSEDSPSGFEGLGTTLAATSAHNIHGNTNFYARATRPNLETRTPTAWGELKTYIEIDFLSTAVTNNAIAASNTGVVAQQTGGAYDTSGNLTQRFAPALRQAYGTLGPILMGQTNTLFDDGDARADIMDAGGDAGFASLGNLRVPQFRYTFLAGGGLSFAVDAELQGTPWVESATYATGTSVAAANAASATAYNVSNPTISALNSFSLPSDMIKMPAVVGKARIDQPWGHADIQAAWLQNRIDSSSGEPAPFCVANTGGSDTCVAGILSPSGVLDSVRPVIKKNGFIVGVGGHLNTFGKDKLGGVFNAGEAAGSYFDGTAAESILYNRDTGAVGAVKFFGGGVNYLHFWTDAFRSAFSVGWDHMNNPGTFTSYSNGIGNGTTGSGSQFTATPYTVAQANLLQDVLSSHINLQWAPIPQINWGVEWQHKDLWNYSTGTGHVNRIDAQFKFFW
jgi:hypothetical protein